MSEESAQIDGVERILRLEPRSRVLDLCCGAGRQTLELARRGHRVLGVDPVEPALAGARQAARAEKLMVHFLKHDIQQLPYRTEFDAVLSFGGSFGALPSERGDQRCLESVRKALKPGGRLLLDLLNKERLMRRAESESDFDLERGRLRGLRVYALTEIKALLERAGLCYQRCWGGFDGSAYGLDSPRMLVLATRPPERAPARRPEPELASAIRIKGRSQGRR